jgi:hypothetical protein
MMVPCVVGGAGGFGLSFPPPHPRNKRIVPTIAPAMMIAARIVHLLFPPGSTSGPGFVGLGAVVGTEFLDTFGNGIAAAAGGNSGRTDVSTLESALSFADPADSSACRAVPVETESGAVCAITGARLRAIVMVHDITADNFGCRSLILGCLLWLDANCPDPGVHPVFLSESQP